MTNIEVQRLREYDMGAANKYINLKANYHPENETIDLIASCEIKENYILPSDIKIEIDEKVYPVTINNQIGLLYSTNPNSNLISNIIGNIIYCNVNYKIFTNIKKNEEYPNAILILHKNSSNHLQSSPLNNMNSQPSPLSDTNLENLKQLYFHCKPNQTFSFDMVINRRKIGTSRNYSVNIGKLGSAISTEFNIEKKNDDGIEKLTPIKTTIKDNKITSIYSNLKIEPGTHEFIVGFKLSVFGSVTFSLEIQSEKDLG